MKIKIRARDVNITKALRSHVELRLGFALSRFGEHIGDVAVELSKSDEHRDHLEKRCRIAVSLPRGVKVQETDVDVFAAVNRAADRAARSVAHAIERDRAAVQVQGLFLRGIDGDWQRRWSDQPASEDRRKTSTGNGGLKRRYSSAPLRKSPQQRDA